MVSIFLEKTKLMLQCTTYPEVSNHISFKGRNVSGIPLWRVKDWNERRLINWRRINDEYIFWTKL